MSSTRPEDWILATTNSGKLAEFRDLLSGTPINLHALDPGSDVPAETGLSFAENALIKARHASRVSEKPAIADDSGLCVAALAGAPGVRSARYAGLQASDLDNLERLLAELATVEADRRQALYYVSREWPEKIPKPPLKWP